MRRIQPKTSHFFRIWSKNQEYEPGSQGSGKRTLTPGGTGTWSEKEMHLFCRKEEDSTLKNPIFLGFGVKIRMPQGRTGHFVPGGSVPGVLPPSAPRELQILFGEFRLKIPPPFPAASQSQDFQLPPAPKGPGW